MYLLDTNVISEFRKGHRCDAGVISFFATIETKTLFIPVQVIGEIQAGIAKLRRTGSDQANVQAEKYEQWLDGLLHEYKDRVLDFNVDSARMWGTLLLNEKKDPHTIDKQIAGIALVHDLTVVTRDKGEAFSKMTGVKFLNPFGSGSPGPDNNNGYAPAA